MSLKEGEGTCTVIVKDDGVGVGDEALRSCDAIGLIGMREGAGWLGGQVDIERRSSPLP